MTTENWNDHEWVLRCSVKAQRKVSLTHLVVAGKRIDLPQPLEIYCGDIIEIHASGNAPTIN